VPRRNAPATHCILQNDVSATTCFDYKKRCLLQEGAGGRGGLRVQEGVEAKGVGAWKPKGREGFRAGKKDPLNPPSCFGVRHIVFEFGALAPGAQNGGAT